MISIRSDQELELLQRAAALVAGAASVPPSKHRKRLTRHAVLTAALERGLALLEAEHEAQRGGRAA
jgi:hypothetical protein